MSEQNETAAPANTPEATPSAPAVEVNANEINTPANAESTSAETSNVENNQPASENKTEEPATPDWFMKDKYKTIEDQAKAYKELHSKVSKNWGPPKDDYSLEGIEGVSKDDPLLSNIAPALKELGISQDGFNHLVKSFQQANVKMAKKLEEALKKELTENDAHTYNEINRWMQQILQPDEIEQIKNNWLMTPADFKLFNSLRLMAGSSSNVPSQSGNNGPSFESSLMVENDKIKYRKEVKQGMRVKDKNYEDQLASRYRDAVAREQRSRG